MTDFSICGDPQRRHDFVLLFDVTDGNPNGDPDAGNMPRVDPETMHGLVTDVCIKRKVRNYVTLSKNSKAPYDIYVNDRGVPLVSLQKSVYDDSGIAPDLGRANINLAREKMCEKYYDVRMFGAVMSVGKQFNAGQVRGPLQLTFGRSASPIVPMDVAITRVAITRPEDVKAVEAAEGQDAKAGKTTEIGRKALIPYGLYLTHGFFTAPFAAQTRVTKDDLELFWKALMNMWDLDHSAARGTMSCRGLYVFSHNDPLGNAPAHILFSKLNVLENEGVEAPRRFEDYTVLVDNTMPEGVTLTKLVGN